MAFLYLEFQKLFIQEISFRCSNFPKIIYPHRKLFRKNEAPVFICGKCMALHSGRIMSRHSQRIFLCIQQFKFCAGRRNHFSCSTVLFDQFYRRKYLFILKDVIQNFSLLIYGHFKIIHGHKSFRRVFFTYCISIINQAVPSSF